MNSNVGAFDAVNGAGLFPNGNESTTAVMNLTFMQFFSTKFGIFLGKVETLQGDANEFADYNPNKFMNFGLNLNLVNALVPISALGGGVILIPWDGAIFNAGVIDPNGKATDSGFNKPFKDGITLFSEGRVAVKPFDLTGHQDAGFTWSNKERTTLDQDPTNLARALLFNKFPRLQDPGPILGDILAR